MDSPTPYSRARFVRDHAMVTLWFKFCHPDSVQHANENTYFWTSTLKYDEKARSLGWALVKNIFASLDELLPMSTLDQVVATYPDSFSMGAIEKVVGTGHSDDDVDGTNRYFPIALSETGISPNISIKPARESKAEAVQLTFWSGFGTYSHLRSLDMSVMDNRIQAQSYRENFRTPFLHSCRMIERHTRHAHLSGQCSGHLFHKMATTPDKMRWSVDGQDMDGKGGIAVHFLSWAIYMLHRSMAQNGWDEYSMQDEVSRRDLWEARIPEFDVDLRDFFAVY